VDEHVKEFNEESVEQSNAQTYTHACSIRFKGAKKAYTFGTNDIQYTTGDQVIVDTIRGLELGEVIAELRPLEKVSMSTPLKPVLRKATKQDLDNFEKNKTMSVDAMKTCDDSIRKLGLDMHLISAEYTLDRSKVIFSYVADERVDFRELLKELASIFKCRIELRQIGPRDKAKFIGGLGTCGMETCCSRFLPDFDVISINMAKKPAVGTQYSKVIRAMRETALLFEV
jgi:cell fate regulator YaaT (PSP1 superfamily)